ncbi:diaminopimelate epimerase [Candidatus Tisiphia endosymbiont of Oplodontha viridula]|uniref:diaminopimelate epimerase n=1 Tax=Candidatus Tisiphia endosymbiont of Oplodontha viridula TaxID=3077925 RepID=UPI003977CF2A
MSQKINFAKMHGLGNDFVIINQRDLPKNCDLQQLSLKIANRHTGIGCDQFIIYDKKPNYYEMIIYNQDGSSAKLCGNASRCLAKLVYLDLGIKEITLRIDPLHNSTSAGNLCVDPVLESSRTLEYAPVLRSVSPTNSSAEANPARGLIYGKELSCKILNEHEIEVDSGIVSFEEDWMPSSEKIWPVVERYMIDIKEVICADIGNPHFVIFSDLAIEDKEIIGEKLQEKELFADGVNVNFASIKDNKIYLSVWERGTGLTLACGSGACASFASAVKLGFISSPCQVVFQLGSLQMSKQGENIIMTGPATLVSRGEFFYD